MNPIKINYNYLEAGKLHKKPLPVLTTANAQNKVSAAPGTSGLDDYRRPFTINESIFDKPQT